VDGVYELTFASQANKGSQTIVKGNPMVAGEKTNNATQFVYITTDTDGTKTYETFVGYKNIPSTNTGAAEVTYYTDADTGIVALMFVEIAASAVKTTAADVTVIAYDADVALTDDGSNKVYYEYNAVVGGEVTTVKVASSEWADISAAGAFYAVTGITYNNKGVGTIVGAYGPTSATGIKVDGEAVIIDGSTSYSYDEDTLAILVDDGAISVIDVTDIKEDSSTKNPYSAIAFKVDADDNHILDVVIVVKA
jgi:hypothetical protein